MGLAPSAAWRSLSLPPPPSALGSLPHTSASAAPPGALEKEPGGWGEEAGRGKGRATVWLEGSVLELQCGDWGDPPGPDPHLGALNLMRNGQYTSGRACSPFQEFVLCLQAWLPQDTKDEVVLGRSTCVRAKVQDRDALAHAVLTKRVSEELWPSMKMSEALHCFVFELRAWAKAKI